MIDLVIQVEDDKLWHPGSRKIMNIKKLPLQFRIHLLRYFSIYMANIYVMELRKAIDTQRFKRFWKALSEKYKEFKKEMGWSEKIWEATGLLRKSVSFWKIKNGYKIGIKSNKYYKTEIGKKIKVRDVMMWMEYGTGERAEGGKGKKGFPGMPPRPLFRPLRDRLSKDISIHFKHFTREFGKEIDELIVMSMVGAK